MDHGRCHEQFGQFFCSKSVSNHLRVEFKSSRETTSEIFALSSTVQEEGKIEPVPSKHVTMNKNRSVQKQQFLALKSFFIFHCQKLFASQSYQRAISFTHGFQHYRFLGKLTCTEYKDFGKCQHRFGRFPWSKNDSNYLDVKHKMFKRDDNRDFCLVQNLKMGDTDFSGFKR